MFLVYFLTLVIVGAIAASGFIQGKLPQSKAAFEFVKPYEGWIGIVSLVLSVYWILRVVIHLGTMLKYQFLFTVIYLSTLVLLGLLSLLMSQSLLKQLLGKNKATEFVDSSASKFAGLQEKLGLAALGSAVLMLIIRFT